MAPRFLVCPPGQYGVRYAINPWMTPHVGNPTPDAVRQWERFAELMGCIADVELVTLESQAPMPDLVFTANAALMIGNLAIVSSFRHAERRRTGRADRPTRTPLSSTPTAPAIHRPC